MLISQVNDSFGRGSCFFDCSFYNVCECFVVLFFAIIFYLLLFLYNGIFPHRAGGGECPVDVLPGCTSPNPRHLAVGWLAGWLSGLRVRECVLCTYSYAGGRLADWLAHLRVRAYVRCKCRFTKVESFSC